MNNKDGKCESTRFSRRKFTAAFSAAVASAACARTGAAALADGHGLREVNPDQYVRCVERAIGYLESQGQAQDGSFSTQAGVGVADADDDLAPASWTQQSRSVGRQVASVYRKVRATGRRHLLAGGMLANYETCLAIMCLKEANRGSALQPDASQCGGLHSRLSVG